MKGDNKICLEEMCCVRGDLRSRFKFIIDHFYACTILSFHGKQNSSQLM